MGEVDEVTSLVVFRRELKRIVLLPQSYAIAAAFLVISGIFFVNIIISTESPDLSSYYTNISATLIVLLPVVAMRAFAEERMTGGLNLTLSWPISRLGLVVGKYLANLLYAWVLLTIAWIYVRLLSDVSPVSIPRAVGGYFGVLLLGAAFCSLSMFVSARASNAAAAAFMGFLLLTFLWILQYAPGWMHSVSRLGPEAHLTELNDGRIHYSDLAYFGLMIALGLFLTVMTISQARPGHNRSTLARSGATFGVAIAVLVAIPPISDHVKGQININQVSKSTLSQATRDILANLKQPITITGYLEPEQSTAVVARVRQYKAAGANITLHQIDPDRDPAQAKRAGIQNYVQYVVQVGGRSETLQDVNEITLTSAISRLARQSTSTACFTTGHGERGLEDTQPLGIAEYTGQLKFMGYHVQPLALGGLGGAAQLQRCDVVLMIGPRAPLLPDEFTMMDNYLKQGGHLVLTADGTDSPVAQLNQLINPWGVGFTPGGIVYDSRSLADDPASLISNLLQVPGVFKLDATTRVVMSDSLAVTETPQAADATSKSADNSCSAVRSGENETGVANGAHVSALVCSSNGSTIKDNLQKTLARGPFVLAALSETNPNGSGTRIAVTGSTDLVSNRFGTTMNNQNLGTALLQWANQEKNIITAHNDSSQGFKLVLTGSQKSMLIRNGIVIPTIIVLLFLPFAFVRLKRG